MSMEQMIQRHSGKVFHILPYLEDYQHWDDPLQEWGEFFCCNVKWIEFIYFSTSHLKAYSHVDYKIFIIIEMHRLTGKSSSLGKLDCPVGKCNHLNSFQSVEETCPFFLMSTLKMCPKTALTPTVHRLYRFFLGFTTCVLL